MNGQKEFHLFFQRTIKEASEGLPSVLFMKFHINFFFAINEINFIKHILIPIGNAFVTKIENMYFITNNINDNLSKWR